MPPKKPDMPPKASSTPGRADPITLDHLFEVLSAKETTPENRAYLILSLATVAHHPVVKQILANEKYHSALSALIAALTGRDVYAGESRWETMTIIGELCRSEHRGDVHGQSVDALNAASKYFFEFFANEPSMKPALELILKEKGFADNDCRIAAKDIYQAMYGKIDGVVTGQRSEGGKAVEVTDEATPSDAKKEKTDETAEEGATAAASSSTSAEAPAAASTSGRIVYTKVSRQRCKDLMFLDATQNTLIPLVSRSSSLTCAQCQKALDVAKQAPIRCGQCKATYYCTPACQVEHWRKGGHKAPCNNIKSLLDDYLMATMNGRRAAPPTVALPLDPSLFYETRPYLYMNRPDTLRNVGFEQYFMEYYHPTF